MAAARGDEPGSRSRRWESAGDTAAARSRRVILYSVRRYLNFTEEEWDALSWDRQRAYLDGLSEDESVPFSFQAAQTAMPGGTMGPQVRTNVDAGTNVINLADMLAGLEAGRKKPGGGR